MKRRRTLGLLCVTLLTVESAYADKVVPFLNQHCISCHGAEKPKGDVRFDGPAPDLTDPKVSEKWRMARRMLAQGEMPPEGKPRPTADELLAAMNWIEAAAARAAVVTRGGVGRRALRRLTNREYVATLFDLLGLSSPHATGDLSTRLPSDAIANTFGNDSNLQVTQALLLRRSLDLAEDPGDVVYPLAAVTVTASKVKEYVLEVPVLLADGDWKSFRRQKQLLVQIDNAAAALGPTPTPENYDSKKRDTYLKRNRLLIESFSVELDAASTWPPQSEAVLLAPRDGEDDEARAKRSLQAFLPRAFRRPVEDRELDAFVKLYRDQRSYGRPFLDAYKTTVAAALVSPQGST